MAYKFSASQGRVKGAQAALVVIGYLSAILSIMLYPYVFGVLAVAMGIITYRAGIRSSMILIVVSVILLFVGIIYGDIILNYVTHYLKIPY